MHFLDIINANNLCDLSGLSQVNQMQYQFLLLLLHPNTQQSSMSLRAKLILTFSSDYYKETKVQTAPLFHPSPLVIHPNLTALHHTNI